MKVKVWYVDDISAGYNWGLGNWEGVITQSQREKLKEDFYECMKKDSDFLEKAISGNVTLWELVQIIIGHEDANFTKEEITEFLDERLEIEWLDFCEDCLTEYEIEI
jgi:hypothetical protein